LDPSLCLAVPESREKQAIAEAGRFPGLPVNVASRPGLEESLIVRPDGYVAGRGTPDDSERLLGLLAAALGTHALQPTK
jgi:hypothetical protein